MQVIQSSPNRDQLKAHLKPPPSLLARGDGAFTTNKSGGRTITTVKTQKPSQTIQNKQAQNKTQAVMLRHVFATARQATSTEVRYFFENYTILIFIKFSLFLFSKQKCIICII